MFVRVVGQACTLHLEESGSLPPLGTYTNLKFLLKYINIEVHTSHVLQTHTAVWNNVCMHFTWEQGNMYAQAELEIAVRHQTFSNHLLTLSEQIFILWSAKLAEHVNVTNCNVQLQKNSHERKHRDDILCISCYISSCKTATEFQQKGMAYNRL